MICGDSLGSHTFRGKVELCFACVGYSSIDSAPVDSSVATLQGLDMSLHLVQ